MKKNLPGAADNPRRRGCSVAAGRDACRNTQSRFPTAQSPDTLALLNEVERLLDLARSESYYEILGLQPDSSRSEVKRKFYQLARQFHPDRHMDRPDCTQRLQMLMDALTVAYRALSGDAAKKAYDSRSKAPEAGRRFPGTHLFSQECLKNAQKCIQVKNYVESVLWLRRAIDLEPHSSGFRTLLARSLAAIPEYRHEAVEQFEKAIRLDSRNVAAHFEYAGLLEQLKFPLRARAYYVRVLELDPRHLQARERLTELDVRSPRTISRSSLLTRLAGRRLGRP